MSALAALRAHPRHLLLGGMVAGLLSDPLAPELACALAIALALLAAPRPALALTGAAAVLSGGLLAHARLHALDRSALHGSLGAAVRARATLLEASRPSPPGGRFARARLEDGRGRGEQVLLRAGRRTRWPPAEVGDVLSVRGRLEPLAPHDDYQRRRGAHAVLVLHAISRTGAHRGGAVGALDRARSHAEAGIAVGLAAPEAALARGMVLGEDERLSDPVREDFRRSGLSHLLAASGQNVMLLAALALPVLTALGLGLRQRLGIVLALVGAYVPLAGAGPSIQRAGAMGAAGLAAGLAGRPASRWYALLLAALITLALNPRAAGDPGWQLSFAAVVTILAASGRLRERLTARRVPGGLAEALALTLSATLGTAPLIGFHFGRLSLASVPANLLAAPAVGPVMWLGMISAALGELTPSLAVPVNALNAYPLAFLEWLAHVAGGAPGASVDFHLGSPLSVGAAYAAIAAPFAARRRRSRLALAAASAMVGVILLVVGGGATGSRSPPPEQLVMSFLDVGQGDATLLQHRGATVLVDTGPPDGPILTRLRRAGVGRIDVLVVTHAQADHEGGAAAVMTHHPVGLLLDGGAGAASTEHQRLAAAASQHGVRHVVPDAGQRIRAGPLELDVLWPHAEPAALHAGQDPNQRAIVARVRDGLFSAMLTADAESDVTSPLDLAPVTALKVAHHASADPGLPEELTRLRPRVAVIEVGRHNSYGHPTAQALAALKVVPRLYRTDRDGTVRVTVEGSRLRVTTDRRPT
ncbi:MAG: ComEC/Rec2 family competence protein [Actinomycetota bacterium]|nr:ComEC/Rec2 family competence protein [Actinomycetota bacterium]